MIIVVIGLREIMLAVLYFCIIGCACAPRSVCGAQVLSLFRKSRHGLEKYVTAVGDVAEISPLFGAVAESLYRGDKNHRAGAHGAEELRVMAGAAVHALGGKAQLLRF